MHKFGDIAFALIVVAGILVVTRKGSQGAGVINALGGAFAGSIGAATGAGTRTRSKVA